MVGFFKALVAAIVFLAIGGGVFYLNWYIMDSPFLDGAMHYIPAAAGLVLAFLSMLVWKMSGKKKK